jgi:hypothetical protein
MLSRFARRDYQLVKSRSCTSFSYIILKGGRNLGPRQPLRCMARTRGDALLNRINAQLAERRQSAEERRRRLKKAETRREAGALVAELEALDRQCDELRAHQKALKRGIVPEEEAEQ